MTKALVFATCGLSFLATGCLHPKIGPNSLPRDRSLYSLSLADSWKEVTLLNIVKVRYLDPPVYVDIANIVSSYTLAQGATAGGTIEPGGTSSAVLDGSILFSHSPTITYTPLTGSAYIRGLTTPLAPASVFAAMQNGVPADLILLSSVQSINGLRNEQATLDGIRPADPEFHKVRELLREIQLSGMVRLYVKEDASKQQATLLAFRTDHIPPEIQAASVELRRLLRLNPDTTEFKIVSAPLPSNDTEVAVITRSITGILQNMAAGKLDQGQVREAAEVLLEHRRNALPSVSVAVAARLLDVSRTTVEAWRSAGVLTPAAKRQRHEVTVDSLVRLQVLISELKRLGRVRQLRAYVWWSAQDSADYAHSQLFEALRQLRAGELADEYAPSEEDLEQARQELANDTG